MIKILAIIIIVLVLVIVMLVRTIAHKDKKYIKLLDAYTSDMVYSTTLTRFMIYLSTHTQHDVMLQDMINAVKSCLNSELYTVTELETGDDISCEKFAEAILNESLNDNIEGVLYDIS